MTVVAGQGLCGYQIYATGVGLQQVGITAYMLRFPAYSQKMLVCQDHFEVTLPSFLIAKRTEKFLAKLK